MERVWRICPNLFSLAYIIPSAQSRRFKSRDAFVSKIIVVREKKVPADSPGPYLCQRTLGCILNTVGGRVTARWSAGASILAFIPTIAALMSNSIDGVMLAAEEDLALAFLLSLCSITAFATGFGRIEGRDRAVEEIVSEVNSYVQQASSDAEDSKAKRNRMFRWLDNEHAMRLIVLGLSYFALLGGYAAVSYAVYVIQGEGVVVFSCPRRFHLPLWVVTTQAIGLLNVLMRRSLFTRRKLTIPSRGPANTLLLRCQRSSVVSSYVHGVTSIMSFALYAFATGILGGMTMFTSSEAIWCMVLFAGAAGIGRIICGWASTPFGTYKATHVADVSQRYMEEVESQVKAIM